MTNRVRKMVVLAIAIALAVDLMVVLAPRAYRKILVARIDPVALFDQIRLGDNLDHVESLFGLPPGDYRTNPEVVYFGDGKQSKVRARYPSERERSWQFDTCEVLILLEEEGRIGAALSHGASTPSKLPTFLQRVWEVIRLAIPF